MDIIPSWGTFYVYEIISEKPGPMEIRCWILDWHGEYPSFKKRVLIKKLGVRFLTLGFLCGKVNLLRRISGKVLGFNLLLVMGLFPIGFRGTKFLKGGEFLKPGGENFLGACFSVLPPPFGEWLPYPGEHFGDHEGGLPPRGSCGNYFVSRARTARPCV